MTSAATEQWVTQGWQKLLLILQVPIWRPPPLRSLLWFLSVSQGPLLPSFLQALTLLGQCGLFPYLSSHFVTSVRASMGAGSLAVLPGSAGLCMPVHVRACACDKSLLVNETDTALDLLTRETKSLRSKSGSWHLRSEKILQLPWPKQRLVWGRCWGAGPFTEQREQESARADDIMFPQSNNQLVNCSCFGNLPSQTTPGCNSCDTWPTSFSPRGRSNNPPMLISSWFPSPPFLFPSYTSGFLGLWV